MDSRTSMEKDELSSRPSSTKKDYVKPLLQKHGKINRLTSGGSGRRTEKGRWGKYQRRRMP